jgi:hypothetical protein
MLIGSSYLLDLLIEAAIFRCCPEPSFSTRPRLAFCPAATTLLHPAMASPPWLLLTSACPPAKPKIHDWLVTTALSHQPLIGNTALTHHVDLTAHLPLGRGGSAAH